MNDQNPPASPHNTLAPCPQETTELGGKDMSASGITQTTGTPELLPEWELRTTTSYRLGALYCGPKRVSPWLEDIGALKDIRDAHNASLAPCPQRDFVLQEASSDSVEHVRQNALNRLSKLICQAVEQRTDDIDVTMQERVLVVLEAECVARSSSLCGNEILVRTRGMS